MLLFDAAASSIRRRIAGVNICHCLGLKAIAVQSSGAFSRRFEAVSNGN
jgi:hypothetical protein